MAKCEMCDNDCRNPKTYNHPVKGKITVCWDCLRRLLRQRDRQQRDLKPASDDFKTEFKTIELQSWKVANKKHLKVVR